MKHRHIYRRVFGKIQITALAYERMAFRCIYGKLCSSQIFHRATLRKIVHKSSNDKLAICNCTDILRYLANLNYKQVKRVAQLFVPVIIVDIDLHQRSYMICELIQIHDSLLKTRKDFFIEDFEEASLLEPCFRQKCTQVLNSKGDCMLGNSDAGNSFIEASRQHRRHSEDVDVSAMREIVKKLYNKSSRIPILNNNCYSNRQDLRIINKENHVCNECRSPNQLFVDVVDDNCTSSSESCQSNNNTVVELDEQLSDNGYQFNSNENNKSSEAYQFSNNSNTVKNNSSNSHISGGSRVRFANQTPSFNTARNTDFPRYSQGTSNSRFQSVNPRTTATTNRHFGSRQFLPSKSVNFRWQNETAGNDPRFSKVGGRQSHFESGYRPNLSTNEFEEDNNGYEVLIDDEYRDLDNVDTITVRDGDGNSKIFVEYNCEPVTNNLLRASKLQPTSSSTAIQGSAGPDLDRSSRRVSFSKESPSSTLCEPNTLTKAVLNQEANSMDTLMTVLNRKVERDEMKNCMRLSVRAEHVIRRPEGCAESTSAEANNDCLTVSSEVQAQWENINCGDEGFPDDNTGYKAPYSGKPSITGTSRPSLASNSAFVSDSYVQKISDLADQAIQTDNFLFYETDNERLVISPNQLGSQRSTIQPSINSTKASMATNTVSMMPMKSKIGSPQSHMNYADGGSQFYFYEDPEKRIICSPSPLCFEHKQTQTLMDGQNSHSANVPSMMQYFPSTLQPNILHSVGPYYQDPQTFQNDLSSRYMYSQQDDPRYFYNNEMSNYYHPKSTITNAPSLVSNLRPSNLKQSTMMGEMKLPRQSRLNPSMATNTQIIEEIDNYGNTQFSEKSSQNLSNSQSQNGLTVQINHSSSNNNFVPIQSSSEDYFYVEAKEPFCQLKYARQQNCQVYRCQDQNNNNNSIDPRTTSKHSSVKNTDRCQVLDIFLDKIEKLYTNELETKRHSNNVTFRHVRSFHPHSVLNKPPLHSNDWEFINYMIRLAYNSPKHTQESNLSNKHINSIRCSNSFQGTLQFNPFMYLTDHQMKVLQSFCKMIRRLERKTKEHYKLNAPKTSLTTRQHITKKTKSKNIEKQKN